eukprot:scaffold10518_cov15-Tisochrysis_lutea.AAC.1
MQYTHPPVNFVGALELLDERLYNLQKIRQQRQTGDAACAGLANTECACHARVRPTLGMCSANPRHVLLGLLSLPTGHMRKFIKRTVQAKSERARKRISKKVNSMQLEAMELPHIGCLRCQ